jgi:hypothetical protein
MENVQVKEKKSFFQKAKSKVAFGYALVAALLVPAAAHATTTETGTLELNSF